MSFTRTSFIAASLLALGAGLASAETAPTPAADGKSKRLAACQPALDTLCASLEKGGGRKIKCLKENEAKLTAECKTALDAAMAAYQQRQAAKAAGAAAPAAPAAPAPAPAAPAQK